MRQKGGVLCGGQIATGDRVDVWIGRFGVAYGAGGSFMHDDRAEALRSEAGRCLALAQTTQDRNTRAELVCTAAGFHELANSVNVPFSEAPLKHDALTMPPISKPVIQKQQR
jgi:hypothetical protein